MGSEGPSAVTVHVTGFKKFIGIPENPTEKIVSNLKSYMEKRGLPKKPCTRKLQGSRSCRAGCTWHAI